MVAEDEGDDDNCSRRTNILTHSTVDDYCGSGALAQVCCVMLLCDY